MREKGRGHGEGEIDQVGKTSYLGGEARHASDFILPVKPLHVVVDLATRSCLCWEPRASLHVEASSLKHALK
jgi:hypothetical protein